MSARHQRTGTSIVHRIVLAVAMLAPGIAWADTYDTATLVDVVTVSKDDVQFLYDSRIDIVGVHDGMVKALLTADQFLKLTERGLRVVVLDDEMKADRARWAENDALAGFASSYYTASKFNAVNPPAGSLMEHLVQQYAAHPDITRLYNLGASQDGAYDIIAMKVTKNPDAVEAEPKIRLYANIHGDEKGGVMVTCDVLDTILAGYTAVPQNATAKKLVDETEIWFIPMGNPYGNQFNSRYNSRGVDLNRNFWGPAGSDRPPAWSEKETQIIRDLTEASTADHAKKRFALSISFHEGATVFNSVWNYTTNAPADEPVFWSSRTGGTGCVGQTIPNCPTLAPHGLAQAYKDGCTKSGFWYTEGYDWYGTRGDTNDWAYGAWGQLDTTIELNTQKTPAAPQIPTYCAEHRQAVLNYMMKVFQGIHGVMTELGTGAPLDGTVTVTATASADIPVPHAYQTISTDPVAGDFHRVLQPGTYTVVCNAPGHATTTVTGVVVTADTKSVANCVMSVTGLADLAATMSGPGSAATNANVSFALGVTNNGSSAASNVQFATATPEATRFVSMAKPAGWSCTTPAPGANGAVGCQAATLAAGGTANFTMVVKVAWCAGDGTVLGGSVTTSSSNNDPAPANNTASANVIVEDNGACDDGNACTAGDACAGNVCAGTPIPAPPETQNLSGHADKATYSWSPAAGAAQYDVVRGDLNALPVGPGGADEVCFGNLPGATVSDPDAPAPDAGFWYLSRGENACGVGTFGPASDGSPRLTTTCP